MTIGSSGDTGHPPPEYAEPGDDEEFYDEDAGPVVRPYAVTGGRTRPTEGTLELVALVTATEHALATRDELDPDQRRIVALCTGLQSLVEISAQLDLPIGVARVLVGDMVDAGLVRVHRPERPTQRPDAALMEKVLDGLQAL